MFRPRKTITGHTSSGSDCQKYLSQSPAPDKRGPGYSIETKAR